MTSTSQASLLKARIDGAQPKSERGVASGYCDLGADAKVPAARLPATSEAFPVGSVFISVVATNPGTLLGYGTWSAIGAGKTLVGLDSGDPDFDAAEETGGSKTHQHDAISAGTPAGTVSAIAESESPPVMAPSVTGSSPTYAASNHTHPAPTFSGAALATHQHAAASNVMPYLVVYIWKRTA